LLSWTRGGTGGARGSSAAAAAALSIALCVGCAAGDEVGEPMTDGSVAPLDDGQGQPRPAPPPTEGSPPSADVGSRITDRSMGPGPTALPGASHPTSGRAELPLPRYVTGLRLAVIVEVLERHGLACEPPDGTVGDVEWSCAGVDLDRDVTWNVVIDGADTSRITHVTALISQFGAPDLELAAAFLGDIVAVDYRGARPARARDWVRLWLNGSGPDEVTAGDAVFVLQGTLESCSLDIVAPAIPGG
jgi:hypothetical protein